MCPSQGSNPNLGANALLPLPIRPPERDGLIDNSNFSAVKTCFIFYWYSKLF